MGRRTIPAVALAAAVTGMLLTASPAQAAPIVVTPGATAVSMPTFTGTASSHPNLALTGSLGGLLDGLISPIVNTALNPLVSALQGLSFNSLISSATGSSSSYVASSLDQQVGPAPAAFPADANPVPCGAAYGTPCYSAATSAITLGPLASLGLNTFSGYTQQVPATVDATNPILGRAGFSSTTVGVLPGVSAIANPIVTTGRVDAKANCPNNGTSPSTAEQASTVSVANGLVTFSVANGDIANLKVNGTTYGTLPAFAGTTVNGIGVDPYGASAIRLTIPLTAAQLIGGLGLPSSAVTELLNDTTGSTMALRVIVGPYDALTTSSGYAWGMGVAIDLSGTLSFNLLGLVGATVALPSGIGGGNFGNVMDLRMSYVSCTSGSFTAAGTPPVPIGLI